MGLRYTPSFRFFYDEAPDAVSRIEELLREAARNVEENCILDKLVGLTQAARQHAQNIDADLGAGA